MKKPMKAKHKKHMAAKKAKKPAADDAHGQLRPKRRRAKSHSATTQLGR